jgi:hypothetical protein
VLSDALGIRFELDQEGKYEEFPAYRAFVLGLEVALLAPPLPQVDIRVEPDNYFQLVISTHAYVKDKGIDVDLNALIEAQLRACTNLELERVA